MSKRDTHIEYETRATPRIETADGVPVFCAYVTIRTNQRPKDLDNWVI